MSQPNILFLITDQQRHDTIRALGCDIVHTPNLDRLVARGLAFRQAYSTCPVCIPARYTIRTGREPLRTGVYGLMAWPGMHDEIEDRCGTYLATAMAKLGYRTFSVGKAHTYPWDAPLGFDVDLRSEELYETPEQRRGDAYAAWVTSQHPEYAWLESLFGERANMYYIPQTSPVPRRLTQESWAVDQAIELMSRDDGRPFFGVVSFISPHPPFAPPVPFNRMYDPDRMPNPVRGDISCDHMDQQIPWMNHVAWADDISDSLARSLRARYYGAISHVDDCIGRLLDALGERGDAENTMVCFFSDHGEHLGDHHAWQKQSFFEPSTKVPFQLSWPARLPEGEERQELVCLTDLFAIATGAAGAPEVRDGVDVLAMLGGHSVPRRQLFGFHGPPGGNRFKIMVREGDWKLIWMANGGRTQLFNIGDDPAELRNRARDERPLVERLLADAAEHLRRAGIHEALVGEELRTFEFETWEAFRAQQFDASRGITGFPERPGNVVFPSTVGATVVGDVGPGVARPS